MSTDKINVVRAQTHRVTVDGVDFFYREAGDASRLTILLLHGYPTSSHQFRHLIPFLAEKYHVLAPDYPGFGFTDVPAARSYEYTFDNLANTVAAFLAKLGITSFVPYIFDYGAPIGLRLALKNPSAVRAIITQNGNAYVEGFGDAFSALTDYYNDPSNKAFEDRLRGFNSYNGTVMQYETGVYDSSIIEPESYTLDSALLSRPGNVEIQLALFRNYATNEKSYPSFQKYLQQHQPPLLAVWGRNDPFFIPAGAEAYKRDVPKAEVYLLEGGHMLLETHVDEVAEHILQFFARNGL